MVLSRVRVAVVALSLFGAAACGSDSADTSEPDSSTVSTSAPVPEAEDDPVDDAAEPVTGSASVPADGDDAVEVEPVTFPLTITDAAGRDLTLDEPAKVGCLWRGCIEILASLGIAPAASEIPAGTDEASAFYFPVGPPEFVVTVLTDLEAWAGADVDVVVLRGLPGPSAAVYEDLVDIFYLYHEGFTDPSVAGFDIHDANTRMLAQLLGIPAAAEEALGLRDAAVARLADFSTPELADRSFAYLFNQDGYRALTDNAPFCFAIADAGLGTCLSLTEGEVGAERILAIDPDLIALQSGATTVDSRDDPTWERLTAVQSGTVYDAGDGLYRCCVTRSLIWALQDFAANAIPESGIPAPGPMLDFDPTTSPLVTGS